MDASRDRRVRKTEAAMRSALVTLMEEKPLAQVTVREVVDLADVNRSTFYRHYLDVPDMAEKIGAEIIAGMLEIMLEYREEAPSGVPAECVGKLAAFLRDKRRAFLALDGEGGDIRFSRSIDAMFRDYARRYLWPTFGEGADDPRLPLLFSFYFSGLSALMREWLSGGCTQGEQYLGQVAESLDRHAQLAFAEVGRDGD
ncbi:MAG: TetR/AcrR family transcriptional regulator [Eggerthellaceae bacterium]